MSQAVKGSFASGQSSNLGAFSDILVVPTNTTTARLTLGGTIDGSNTCKTQKSVSNGASWVDQTTYSTVQNSVAVTVAAGEHWRLAVFTQQPQRQIDYTFSAES